MQGTKILVKNVMSQIVFPKIDAVFIRSIDRYLLDELSFQPKNYRFSYAYQSGKWDGYIRLYNPVHRTFPTGLLTRVCRALEVNGITPDIVDCRNRPVPQDVALHRLESLSLNGIALRDYQIEAIRNAILAERGILDMSTGSGKTEVAAGIIATLQVKTLFIVHLRTLLLQSAKRISERLGCQVAVFGGGSTQWGDITVASIQALHRNLEALKPYLNDVELVIVDEAHHISNNTYFKVLKAINAYYRFGLSGTPLDRTDGSSLITIGLLGEIIHKTSSSELIQRNLLARPFIIFIPVEKAKAFPEGNEHLSGWREVYEEGIITNEYRNNLIANATIQLLKKDRNHILILVKEVEHGKILTKVMQQFGIEAPLLWSTTAKGELLETIAKFRRGEIPVIISSPIFDEGIDIPEIDAIVIAGGGESVIKTIQRIGRGVRKVDGKENLIVVDFIDHHHPILERHSRARVRACQREHEFEVYLPEGKYRERERHRMALR